MSDESFTCDITDAEWDNFVYSHPLGNIFQTRALYNVYAETKNYFPISVAVTDPNTQELKGVMSGVIVREMDGFLGDFSARSIVQGGPLVAPPSNKDVATELVNRYDLHASRSSLYTEIRNMYDVQDTLNHLDNYSFVDHLNFIINLNQSEQDLWGQIHKSRRKNINRAEKAGVVVEELVSPDEIPAFYKLLGETYNNVKVPLADISLFESAFQQLVPKGMAKFYLARHENDYIGARAVLLFKNQIYDWYAGAAVDALPFHPNECLVWHILKWGIENNYSRFDFGGAGEPDKPYGPREFKRRFGGELVNYGRYVHQYSRVKIKVAEIGFKVYRKLFL
jgi:lipid II:glycine glycyltransferase (peptidoglycan interpeptide bridge formation enzyme)